MRWSRLIIVALPFIVAWIPVQETGTALLQTILQTGQSILTTANTAKSNVNEVLQLNQQLQGYVQDAKAFVALPMSYVDQVSSLYQQYNQALNQAQGVAYTLRNSVTQFDQLYEVATHGSGGMLQQAQAMLQQVRAASQAATAATALFDRLCAQQGSVGTLITASQAAVGPLGAQQATNQLLGVLADQNGSLQQMQATIGRVQVGYIMQETVVAEQAKQNASQFMEGFGTEVLRGPGEGRGFALPQ